MDAIRLRRQEYTPEAMVSQFDAGLHEAPASCLGPFPGSGADELVTTGHRVEVPVCVRLV